MEACWNPENLEASGHSHTPGNRYNHALSRPLEAIGLSAEQILCAEELYERYDGDPSRLKK
jgi:hypothetical protein